MDIETVIEMDKSNNETIPDEPVHSYYIVYLDYFSGYQASFDSLKRFIQNMFLKDCAVYLVVYEDPANYVQRQAQNHSAKTVQAYLAEQFRADGICVTLNRFPKMEYVVKPTVCVLGYNKANTPDNPNLEFSAQEFMNSIVMQKKILEGRKIYETHADSDKVNTIYTNTLVYRAYDRERDIARNHFYIKRAHDFDTEFAQDMIVDFSSALLDKKLASKQDKLQELFNQSFDIVTEHLFPTQITLPDFMKTLILVLCITTVSGFADFVEFRFAGNFYQKLKSQYPILQNWFGDTLEMASRLVAFIFKIIASIKSLRMALTKIKFEGEKCFGKRYNDKLGLLTTMAVFAVSGTTMIPDLQFVSDVFTEQGLKEIIQVCTGFETTARSSRGFFSVIPEAKHIQETNKNTRRSLLEQTNQSYETGSRHKLDEQQLEAAANGQSRVRNYPIPQSLTSFVLGFGATVLYNETQWYSSKTAAASLAGNITLTDSSPDTAIYAGIVQVSLLLFALLATSAKSFLYTNSAYRLFNSALDLLNRPAIPSLTDCCIPAIKTCHDTSQNPAWLTGLLGVIATIAAPLATAGTAGKFDKYMPFGVYSILAALPATGPFFCKDFFDLSTELFDLIITQARLSHCCCTTPNYEELFGRTFQVLRRNIEEKTRIKTDYATKYMKTNSTLNFKKLCDEFNLEPTYNFGLEGISCNTITGGLFSHPNELYWELFDALQFLCMHGNDKLLTNCYRMKRVNDYMFSNLDENDDDEQPLINNLSGDHPFV